MCTYFLQNQTEYFNLARKIKIFYNIIHAPKQEPKLFAIMVILLSFIYVCAVTENIQRMFVNCFLYTWNICAEYFANNLDIHRLFLEYLFRILIEYF